MNTFQERSSALTGSACLEKAVDALHQDAPSTDVGYVKPVRTYRQVGEWQGVQVGDYSIAVAGDSGSAMTGESGAALVGDRGTACAGMFGTASAGVGGTVCAGELSEIRLKYWDEQAQRYRTVTGYIGENGLEPNAHYKLNDQHVLVRACLVDQVGRLRNGQ